MAHEMDVLYGCAWQVWLEDEVDIASRDAERRQLISVWENETSPRMRWYASVILHPSYGPGLTVQRQTHVWRGSSDEPDPEWDGVVRPLRDAQTHAPGWFVHPRTPEAIREEEEMSRRIQACWQQRR